MYSSIAYLYDLVNVLTSSTYSHALVQFARLLTVSIIVMKMVLESGHFSESLTDLIDHKVASWHAMLPACKKDPLRADGRIDEVMWQAHLSAAM